jgi:DNA polymerase III gamma/tau subunit
MTELYKRYRPKKLSEVIGQPEAVEMISTFLKDNKVPQAILFHGPSGTGKTTLARIIAKELKCSKLDFHELNIADLRSIDEVRSIRSRLTISPMNSPCRIWYLDEIGSMMGPAQKALLKILEDTPTGVYFILATTEPEKLIVPIRNRCTKIGLKSVTNDGIEHLLLTIAEKEEVLLTDVVASKIVEHSQGSPRQALVLLNSVIGIKDEQKQLDTIESTVEHKTAIRIAQMLLNTKTQWKDLAAVLRDVDDDPEQLRRMVLGYASAVALNGGRLQRCNLIIQVFKESFWNSGKPGLVGACLECFQEP